MKRRSFLIGLGSVGLFACSKPRNAIDSNHAGIVFKELVHKEPDDGLPLVVAIHGNGGAPAHWVEPWTKFPGRARIVIPQGFDKFEEGFAWFPWVTDLKSEKLGADVSSAEEKLWKGIADLAGSRRVIVAGYEQGATLCYLLALRHPDVVLHAFPVAGACPTALFPKEKTKCAPITAYHGKLDEVIPLEAARASIDAFAKQGVTATLKEYDRVRHRPSDQLHTDLDADMVKALAASRTP